MSEAHQVKEVLGVQATEDGKQMLVGFKTASEEEVALALDGDFGLGNARLLHRSHVAQALRQGNQALWTAWRLPTDWFELGKIDDSKDLALTLVREKAHVTFRLTPSMAEKLGETLAHI